MCRPALLPAREFDPPIDDSRLLHQTLQAQFSSPANGCKMYPGTLHAFCTIPRMMTIADVPFFPVHRRALLYGEDEDAALTARRREFQHHIAICSGVASSAPECTHILPPASRKISRFCSAISSSVFQTIRGKTPTHDLNMQFQSPFTQHFSVSSVYGASATAHGQSATGTSSLPSGGSPNAGTSSRVVSRLQRCGVIAFIRITL